MIKIKKNGKKFKDLFNILSKYNTTLNLEFKNDGLRIFVVDLAKISMIEIIFKPEFFEEYNINDKIICSIDSLIMNKIIKKLSKSEFTLVPSEKTLTLKNNKDNFDMVLYDPHETDKVTPVFEATRVFNVNSSEFFECVNNYVEFDMICEFGSENDHMKLSTSSNKVKGYSFIDSELITCKPDKGAFYNGIYIGMISDIKSIFDELEIHYGSEFPCKIIQSNDELNFSWVLAPRVGQ